MKTFQVNETVVRQPHTTGYQMLPIYRQGIEVGVCYKDRANCGIDPDRMVWVAAIEFDISPSFTSIINMLQWCDDLLNQEIIGVF